MSEYTGDTPEAKGKDTQQNDCPCKAPIKYFTTRVKPLAQITGADIPPGLDPEDVATDYDDP